MGRVFQVEEPSSKALVGNVLGLQGNQAMWPERRGTCAVAGNGGGEKARARPRGPVSPDKDTGFYSV